MAETIKEGSCISTYEQDMVKYSIIVDRRRSIPEDRDGLKPVQRRVIFDTFTQHAIPGHVRVKSSSITGDTMKNFHPHGDGSIYDTMIPLTESFKCKMPLFDGKGNWSSIMGDSAAAQRYTETRLSPFCYDCIIGELAESKNVVDWIDNYQRTCQEPEFLPVKVPLLLINGSNGIGVGLAVSIPPHNLSDVIRITRALIKDKNADCTLIPDCCGPCNIIEADWTKISETGSGSFRVRGKVEITEYNGYPALIVRSLPDRVFTNSITDKLEDMITKKQLPMIKEIFDASGNGVVEIIIQLRKGADPYYVKEVLYAKTKVQDTVSVNFMVVNGVDVRRMSYREYILGFLERRAITKFRLYSSRLQVNLTRYHKLIAYIKLLESGEIDNVIDMIRKQKNIDDDYLIEYLIKKIGVTDLQAKFILGTDIRKLAKGYLEKYKEEVAKLELEQKMIEPAVTDDGTFIMNEIDHELAEIDAKYGSPRICNVIKTTDDNNIPRGVFKIVITEGNYIRKLPDTDKVGIIKRDNPKFVLRVDNTENILLFDSQGKVFKLPIYRVPVTDRNASGTDVRILQKNLTSDIVSVLYEPMLKKIAEGKRKHYLTVVSKNNSIKKLDVEDFLNVNTSGLIYAKVIPGDQIVDVALVSIDFDVIIYSGHKALRVATKNLPLFKRNASGSKAMNTTDEIEGLSVVYPDATSAVVITKNGLVNKFSMVALKQSDRAKAGVSVIKLNSDDSIFSIYGVADNDIIRVVTSNGIQEIPVSNLKLQASTAKGTKLIDLRGATIIRTDVIKG